MTIDKPSSDELNGVVAALWERAQPATVIRLAAMERAIVALLGGSLDVETRAFAARAAHKLAGGLGTFGFSQASNTARQLESIWQGEVPLGAADVAPLAALAGQLRSALPRLPTEEAELIPAKMAVRSTQDRVDVLVVDDDEALGGLVKEVLEKHSLTAAWVPDGAAAAAAVCTSRLRARLVLLDIDMPGENGIRVLRGLRESGALQDTRVVMLTARASSAEVHLAASLGVVDYLVKPLSIPLLIERVERALALKPAA